MGDSVDANKALAAAVAAAAELAKTGGGFIYADSTVASKQDVIPSSEPVMLRMMIPEGVHAACAATNDQEKNEFSHDEDQFGQSDNEDKDLTEEDAERRMARSRERNREHARRTRLRKKAQLEALQSKVKGLQAESRRLKQSLEECNIASILVGLSSGNENSAVQSLLKEATNADANSKGEAVQLVGGKRKRFVTDTAEKPAQPLKINIDGQTTLIGGGRTHINWKSGVYSDENGIQRQLTVEQLEILRRERNRMHAKMTRDRKKSFIATIEKTIDTLESNNKRMKDVLSKVSQKHYKKSPKVDVENTVYCSSSFSSNTSYNGHFSPGSTSVVSHDEVPTLRMEKPLLEVSRPTTKRVAHGFTTLIP